ncbi:MAG: hypothetical protein ACYDEH_07585 [Acidimicrobiales bacterium]
MIPRSWLGRGRHFDGQRAARLLRATGLQESCFHRKHGRRADPASHCDFEKLQFVAIERKRLWVFGINEHPTKHG